MIIVDHYTRERYAMTVGIDERQVINGEYRIVLNGMSREDNREY